MTAVSIKELALKHDYQCGDKCHIMLTKLLRTLKSNHLVLASLWFLTKMATILEDLQGTYFSFNQLEISF